MNGKRHSSAAALGAQRRPPLLSTLKISAIVITTDATGAKFIIHPGAPHGFMMPSGE